MWLPQFCFHAYFFSCIIAIGEMDHKSQNDGIDGGTNVLVSLTNSVLVTGNRHCII